MHFLRRFLEFIQKYVYYHFIFPKTNKRGGWNKSGGLENFSKINKRGGDDYSVLESTRVIEDLMPQNRTYSIKMCKNIAQSRLLLKIAERYVVG